MSARPTLSRILLAFALVTVALPAAAVERGTPNSTARQGYCAGGYSDCLGAGRKDCKSKFTDSGQLESCFSGVGSACLTGYNQCVSAAIIKGETGTTTATTSSTPKKP